jgi:prephenate dehydratase
MEGLVKASHSWEIRSTKYKILNKFEGSNIQMTKIDSRFRGNDNMGLCGFVAKKSVKSVKSVVEYY